MRESLLVHVPAERFRMPAPSQRDAIILPKFSTALAQRVLFFLIRSQSLFLEGHYIGD